MWSGSNDTFFDFFWWSSLAFVRANCKIKFRLWFLNGGLRFISNVFGPCIDWCCPWAGALDSKVIDASDESEISFLPPVCSPRISNDPVFSSVFLTPSSYCNIVVLIFSSSFIIKNSSCVIQKFLSDCDNTTDRASLINFVHDVCLTTHITIFFDSVNFGSLLRPTSLERSAISALYRWRTANAIITTVCLIRWARLISNVILVNPSISCTGISSLTAPLIVLAWNNDLRADDDIRPLGFSLNLDSVTQRACGRECPASTAINWNVLISLNCKVVDSVCISPPEIVWNLTDS